MLCKKKKLDDNETVILMKKCNARIQNKLPHKNKNS